MSHNGAAGFEQYIDVLDQDQVKKFQRDVRLPSSLAARDSIIDRAAAQKDIEEHPCVQALCRAAAAGADSKDASRAAEALRRRAAEMALDMVTAPSPKWASMTSAVSRFMFKRLYSGIIFECGQLAALARLCTRAQEERRSIVFLPSHKSHIDYIVLQFALSNLGLGPATIAAGDNLNIPILGDLLRRNGAFFIRRSFDGPDSRLYTTVVAAYLEGLLRRGAILEFFLEGGRSRSGKLLQPKIGLLGMILQPILSGVVSDAYIVPVSIYYDRVMETRTYVKELLGDAKKKESLLGTLEQGKHLLAMQRSRYGHIYVCVAPGFSAKSYIEQHTTLQRSSAPARMRFDPGTSVSDRAVLLRAMAYHVLEEINRVSSVTPTALVGTVLLCSMGRGVGRTELIWKVEWLRREVGRSGGHVSCFFGFPGELAAEVVDSALEVMGSLVKTFSGLVEPVYAVAPGRSFELSYYRNMCVHVFIHQSIVAAALHRFVQEHPDTKQVKREDVMRKVSFLSKLLKREFVFSGAAVPGQTSTSTFSGAQLHVPMIPEAASSESWTEEVLTAALMLNFESALELMVAEGVVEVGESKGSDYLSLEQLRALKRRGGYELWNPHFTFLCSLVWPVIESYWLVLAALYYIFRHGIVMNTEAHVLSSLQSFAKTLVRLGHMHYDEAASEQPLRQALAIYGEMGIVRWTPAHHDGDSRPMTLELAAEYQVSSSNNRLSRLVDEVASYRRRWREQEGADDFPEYIARMAFNASKL
eukprot:TRINITY_DN60866_c0_g1_i1.p1 TRINITY_DN60866_c0_g1~~TRINITY_DN60866_c0_g1_i1.p1  ORF type:complete len:756 (+),score=132.13 TRINITY_DN60866_c0_g1_i1:22-2289(+)